MDKERLPQQCTDTCLASCDVLSRLGKAGLGMNLAEAQAVVDTVADTLHVPSDCRDDSVENIGGPQFSKDKPGRRFQVCGLEYSAGLANGVKVAVAVLKRERESGKQPGRIRSALARVLLRGYNNHV